MAVVLSSSLTTSPPPPPAIFATECPSPVAPEVPSRPLIEEVLEEEEEIRRDKDIASAQIDIDLAMLMGNIFGSLAEFSIPKELVIQGEPAPTSTA